MSGGMKDWHWEHDFDGEDKGCGEVLIDLKLFFRPLEPGAIVRARSLDPAAPEEMAAWCRMTRNLLLAASHPYYLISKKTH